MGGGWPVSKRLPQRENSFPVPNGPPIYDAHCKWFTNRTVGNRIAFRWTEGPPESPETCLRRPGIPISGSQWERYNLNGCHEASPETIMEG